MILISQPNRISLNQARENFKSFGACEKSAIKFVRKPLPEEIPES
ncbi:MAG: hypothetical protein KKH06_00140 [Gammaproteobacteria bacterium]|nr:hypothetical protein [Gammaproteobacteria bacterium]